MTGSLPVLGLSMATLLVAGCPRPFPTAATTSAADDESDTDGEDPSAPAHDEDESSEESGSESGDETEGAPEPCDPTKAPSEAACVVEDGLGVFVATWGDDTGPGTRDEPLATIAAAMQRAATGSRRVYACAQDFGGDELVVSSNVALFGGLDCDDEWQWIGDTRRTRYSSDGIAMQIAGPIDVVVEDFELESSDATTPGASSIAVVVQGATRALFRRSGIAAGSASAGVDAIEIDEAAAAGLDGEAGRSSDCVPVDTQMFGLGGENPACPQSVGGSGGNELTFGEDGSPAALGGEGGSVTTSPGSCTPGGDGLDGSMGANGEPARGLGSLDLDGWIPPTPSAGSPGAAGGGGGGGAGGLQQPVTCTVSEAVIEYDILGPGGGGGGAGGCGGAGGAPGGSGGSSIAIVSIDAQLVLESTSLRSADGGDGGAGAAGQPGGAGGDGGIGGEPPEPHPAGGSGGVGDGTCASAGGAGGTGGRGGTGGGGAGGHSLGIAYRGTAPLLAFEVDFALGSAGAGGGTVSGDSGVTAQTLAIE